MSTWLAKNKELSVSAVSVGGSYDVTSAGAYLEGGRTGARPPKRSNYCCFHTCSAKFKKHQNQQRPGLRPGPH